MSNIIPICGPRAAPPDERMRFFLARRAMFRAFRDWLDSAPDQSDVSGEIEATSSVLRQLRDISGDAA